MVLSSGDALRYTVGAATSVVQVGPHLGGSDIDMLDWACG
jgi:hypothetical protein